jgi:anthranilate/para-aminobenzoate synthase component II
MLLRVRFCPESIMTEMGKDLLKNFLKQGAQQ